MPFGYVLEHFGNNFPDVFGVICSMSFAVVSAGLLHQKYSEIVREKHVFFNIFVDLVVGVFF